MWNIYHYTNDRAFDTMKDVGKLSPRNHIFCRTIEGLPEKAYAPVICGLLNPVPDEWFHNEQCPETWRLLYNHLTFRDHFSEIFLLGFSSNGLDDAHVFERLHLEKNRKLLEDHKMTWEEHTPYCKDYLNSAVPILEYSGGFSLPEVIIFSPIEFNRLNVVWKSHKKEFGKNFLKGKIKIS